MARKKIRKEEKVPEVEVEVKEQEAVEEASVPKILTREEILKFQYLMAAAQLKEKDIKLTEKKTVSYEYEIKLLNKDRQILDRLIENVKLKQSEVQLEVNGQKELLAKAQKEYRDFVAEVSKKYDIDFYKCTFDPLTGIIEKV